MYNVQIVVYNIKSNASNNATGRWNANLRVCLAYMFREWVSLSKLFWQRLQNAVDQCNCFYRKGKYAVSSTFARSLVHKANCCIYLADLWHTSLGDTRSLSPFVQAKLVISRQQATFTLPPQVAFLSSVQWMKWYCSVSRIIQLHSLPKCKAWSHDAANTKSTAEWLTESAWTVIELSLKMFITLFM